MALAQAILASLATVGPCSGYDLVKRFDEYISCYWMASHQQVYKELRDLEKKGWISPETVAQTGRPNKIVYSITELGQQSLVKWSLLPSEPTPIREPLMIKLKAGHLMPLPATLQELKRRHQLHSTNLDRLKQLEASEFSNLPQSSIDDRLHHLSLRRGIRYEAEWVDWCEEAIQVVQALLTEQAEGVEKTGSAEAPEA